MSKKQISVFVSYAHRNKKLAVEFLDLLEELLLPSRHYQFDLWFDNYIDVGEKWREQILDSLEKADIGLLLVSPAFLASPFISESELPAFIGENAKPMLPVMLSKIDFEKHDLKGLGEYQLYRYEDKKLSAPRAYSELKKKRREQFAWEVFQLIHKKLD
ncbi:toll/interleukin-1 receptor domain-containing protein [Alteromonas halophila]|uniref:TIR domain-containing protein n=1 Tax=Alteromonas halophila TaxID=516698 RepID=A0A918JEI8_9ALTE|nr:toll/interleukin-1 receptor domain-containing protein [Alteromonas halophila]GGW75548.1 hypothetical protein GCM10007391_04820 [Alteromonas halophila]